MTELNSISEYLKYLPDERKIIINKLRTIIKKNLPKGFIETISYKMIGYVVPHNIFPDGYHCDPKLPLPFINIASQKNHIAIYHLGLYVNKELLGWFISEYTKFLKSKLDMGKSCIRFKNINKIPYELIGKLVTKISVKQWIEFYKRNIKK